ncbi:MAG TPA: hypothetical protein VNH18_29435 [Bryobacteraceae bacterium]|nr:hypothetical protein [Blastocatellia bacterium]HXJ43441.1 hypothetical protein [Bryobacteraceae bacterium]
MAKFLEVVASHRSGDILPELDEKLTEVLQAVRSTGKQGAIALVLKVKPYSKGKIETVLIEDEIKVKIPELDKGGSIFFATDDDELLLNDPRQQNLDLREIPQEKPPLKEVK